MNLSHVSGFKPDLVCLTCIMLADGVIIFVSEAVAINHANQPALTRSNGLLYMDYWFLRKFYIKQQICNARPARHPVGGFGPGSPISSFKYKIKVVHESEYH